MNLLSCRVMEDVVDDFSTLGRVAARSKISQWWGSFGGQKLSSVNDLITLKTKVIDETNLIFMTRLGAWRTSDIESYQSAYVSLVLHRFSPFLSCYLFPNHDHHGQDILTNCAAPLSLSLSLPFIQLILHRIFSPIVRHHQLFWSPFTSTVAISEQPWFSQVKKTFKTFW